VPLTFRAAAGANGGSTSTTTVATSFPAGATTGDLVLLCVCFGAAGTFSALSGWTLESQASNSTGATHAAALFSRVLQAGDTAPTVTFSVAAKRSYVSSAWIPAAGETPAVYAKATTVITASGTSHTPNAATSNDPDTVSYVFNGTRAQSAGATAITQTAVSGWTEPTNGDQSTAVGTNNATRQVGAHVAYKTAAGTGSIAPGAAALAGGISGGSVIDIAFHMLLRSASFPQMPEKLQRSPRPSEQGSASGPYAQPHIESHIRPGG
jgi:hypothetical protein